ncbi:MAG: methyltransferase [Alcanivorax sp.]
MRISTFFAIATLSLAGTAVAAPLEQILESPHREADSTRDDYRHPAETLAFFQVEPDMTVVEIWPGGGGWYTAILAPWLRDHGTFYAAQFPADSRVDFYQRARQRYQEKLEARPALYEQVIVTQMGPPEHTDIAPAGSADRVLTFRNVHNWAKAGTAEAAFESFFRALKPGGVLGVVEHRAPAGRPLAEQIESGYMTEAYVIEQAEKAGFTLEANASTNANAADDTEHPAGVWTLPPTLRLGEENRAHYLDIGESDRMTLRFRKPE